MTNTLGICTFSISRPSPGTFSASFFTVGQIFGVPVPCTIRTAGTLSNLWINILTNITGSTGTVTLQKNGSAGNETISVGNNATGAFTDAVNTDSVVVADTIILQGAFAAAGSININDISLTYAATTNTVSRMGSGPFNVYGTPSQTSYLIPIGNSGTIITTEAPTGAGTGAAQMRIRKSFTIKNMEVNVSNNSIGGASTFTSRKNGANGSLTVSIATSASGALEDTTHSDSVVAGDNFNYVLTVGTGTQNLTIEQYWADYVSTNGNGILTTSNVAENSFSASTTRYFGLSGDLNSSDTTEANVQSAVNSSFTFSELTIWVDKNTISASSTLTLRANGSSSGVSLSIGANTTGVVSDSVHTYNAAATDTMNYLLSTGSTGTSMFIIHISSYTAAGAAPPVTTTFAQNFKNLPPNPNSKDWQLLQFQTNEPVFGI